MFAMFGIFGAISIGASAVSLGAGLVEKWARDKKNEELIEKKVNEAVEKRLGGITIIDEDEEEGEEADEG